jgi:type I protein arginine methyltransferase
MYSLTGYGHMLADRVRYEAYLRALQKAVRPGAVVLEIGTGPGIFALEACRLGASRVYAVEPSPVIQVAREIAAANNCADKIEFIENLSTRIDLPAKADVIISDLRGILPLFEQHIPSIADARRRFLAPGGVLIPNKDAIFFAIAEEPKEYADFVDGWVNTGFNVTPATALALNNYKKCRLKPEQMLTSPLLWQTLDYRTVENPDLQGVLDFSVQRQGVGHGIVAWFETCLIDGVGFSNAPGEPEAIYGSMFFPWLEPVSLVEGQKVQVNLRATLADNDYVWHWKTHIPAHNGSNDKSFEQSQLKGAVISMQQLRRSASDFVPHLSEDGILNRRSLELMDGTNSLEKISRQLAAEFPARFARWQQALSWVSKMSDKNSRN